MLRLREAREAEAEAQLQVRRGAAIRSSRAGRSSERLACAEGLPANPEADTEMHN